MLSETKLKAMSPAERFERLVGGMIFKRPRYRRVTLTCGNELFFAYGEGPDGNWTGIAGFVYETPFAQTFDFSGNMSEKAVQEAIIKYAEETVL